MEVKGKDVKVDAKGENPLVKEKIELAKKLGIWKKYEPVEKYRDTKEYARIKEIDKRLAELG